jgi:hypothetical protein
MSQAVRRYHPIYLILNDGQRAGTAILIKTSSGSILWIISNP